MWFQCTVCLILLSGSAWTAYIPFSKDLSTFDEVNMNSVGSEEEYNSILSFPPSDTSRGPSLWQPISHPSSDYSGNLGRTRISTSLIDNKIHGKGPTKRYPIHLDPLLPPKYWLRTGECPRTPDGAREFFCPSPNANGRWVCVDDHQLCDGVKNCPNADDESPLVCMFYKAMQSQISFVANGIISKQQAEDRLSEMGEWRKLIGN